MARVARGVRGWMGVDGRGRRGRRGWVKGGWVSGVGECALFFFFGGVGDERERRGGWREVVVGWKMRLGEYIMRFCWGWSAVDGYFAVLWGLK